MRCQTFWSSEATVFCLRTLKKTMKTRNAISCTLGDRAEKVCTGRSAIDSFIVRGGFAGKYFAALQDPAAGCSEGLVIMFRRNLA